MYAKSYQKKDAIEKLICLIKSGGPDEIEYDELTAIWNGLRDIEPNEIDSILQHHIARLFGRDFLEQTIQGLGYRKPHGYAGDFEIIDHIYQQKTSEDRRFKKWDKYFHACHAAKAVRN